MQETVRLRGIPEHPPEFQIGVLPGPTYIAMTPELLAFCPLPAT
jgi:hypothetical protein